MDDIKDVRLGIRVDTDTKDDLDKFCLSHNMSISEVGRKAIKAYIENVRRKDLERFKQDVENYEKHNKGIWNSQ